MLTSPSQNFLLFTLWLICFCCIDQVDLVPEKNRLEAVSINGKIVKGNPSVVSVLVQPIFAFSAESRAVTPVSEIYLENEDGQRYDIENQLAIGQYEQVIDPTFEITYDQKYRLVVRLIDGSIYESSLVQVLPSIPIQSLDFEVVQRDLPNLSTGNLEPRDFIQYQLTTPLAQNSSSEKAYLHWKTLKTNRFFIATGAECYATQAANVNYIGIFNGNRTTRDTLIDFPFFSELINNSFLFTDTYYFTILQETVSEEVYQYWREVDLSANRNGNVFESAAGLVRTNISNATGVVDDVQGFFYATEQSRLRIRICPSDLGLSLQGQICDGCFCQSTAPPDFWEACN
ncbi:MAG: DUF4249 family protein [Bacteroidota bacterium]